MIMLHYDIMYIMLHTKLSCYSAFIMASYNFNAITQHSDVNICYIKILSTRTLYSKITVSYWFGHFIYYIMYNDTVICCEIIISHFNTDIPHTIE